MITREQTEDFLREVGFRETGPQAWLAFHTVGGRTLPVFVNLRDLYLQVQVHLHLFSTCHHNALHELFADVNGRRALGKFALGAEVEGMGRPLVLFAELPAGPQEAYTAPELVATLLKMSFDLVAEQYPRIEEIVRGGCAGGTRENAGRPDSRHSLSQRLLERLRSPGKAPPPPTSGPGNGHQGG